VTMAMARPYARSPQGQRVYTSKPLNTGKNITVLGALSRDGIMASMTVEGSTDAQVFLPFVQTSLAPALHAGQVVCMDNRSSQHVDGVQEAIESVGARLEYLPPYSPDLSPLEKCWSKFKAILRAKAARTRDALDQAVTEALAMITPQDARGWFAYCGYLEHIQLRNAIGPDPATHRRMVDPHATFPQECFHVAIAQRLTQRPPHGAEDNGGCTVAPVAQSRLMHGQSARNWGRDGLTRCIRSPAMLATESPGLPRCVHFTTIALR
jgi:transposase